ncbi:MAG: 5'-methylthioadenosine/S-adenosylhomocysteine nucleosidase [Bacteroidetes bacterium]|nr:MAG: 5'-methylthioadenosine/S-adenosylhomocysteine nucleosidase [Bacteroidota bacterium]
MFDQSKCACDKSVILRLNQKDLPMLAIMSAMPEELEQLIRVLEDKTTVRIGKRTFYRGTLYGVPVVLVFSRWGKVAASTTVTQLINGFKIDQLIFSGVAGSTNANVNVGDVVLGTSFFQHDIDAYPLFPTTEVPLLGKSLFDTTYDQHLQDSIEQFIAGFDNYFSDDLKSQFDLSRPTFHQGIIASGDQFVGKVSQIKQILKHQPDTLCVEMEGAAVAQVCYEYDLPFQIIRIISDKADDNAHVDFPAFARQIAGHYARYILELYLSRYKV